VAALEAKVDVVAAAGAETLHELQATARRLQESTVRGWV